MFLTAQDAARATEFHAEASRQEFEPGPESVLASHMLEPKPPSVCTGRKLQLGIKTGLEPRIWSVAYGTQRNSIYHSCCNMYASHSLTFKNKFLLKGKLQVQQEWDICVHICICVCVCVCVCVRERERRRQTERICSSH